MSEEGSYEGQAFHPTFGNEVVEGKLLPLQWALRFEGEQCELEMPFQDLQIELQPAADRCCFRHAKCPDWVIYTSDPRLLDHRAFTSRTPLREQIQASAQRSVWRNALAVTLGCLLVFALLSVLVTWASGYMVRVIAGQIPAAWEKDYGDKLFVEMKDELPESAEPEIAAQLKVATEPLARAVKTEFHFHLVDNPIPNAFAWPGGHVVVYTGLIKLAGSPEELAGALAHEMAHITQKHHFRQTIASQGPYYVTRLFFNKGSFVGLLAAGSHLLIRQNFSRAYEREADDVGWRYLVAANINPRGAIDLLKKLKAEEEKAGMSSSTRSALSSHPPTTERIHRLEAKWSKMKSQTGFMEFSEDQLRIFQSEKQ